jgi:hypothetical protein
MIMSCKAIQRLMALAVGDDLPVSELRQLEQHVRVCAKCQSAWEQHRQGFAVVQQSRIQTIRPLSDSIWPKLANRLQHRFSDRSQSDFNGWIPALAITAACVLVFVFSQETPLSPVQSPRSGPMEETYIRSFDESSPVPLLLHRKDGFSRRSSLSTLRLPSHDKRDDVFTGRERDH